MAAGGCPDRGGGHAATTPVFIYLLVAIGLALLLFEVFQPGFGVAGIAGLIMVAIGVFGLTVLPVAWWAAALIVLGLILFAVDVAIAGFGPVTLAATAAFARKWRRVRLGYLVATRTWVALPASARRTLHPAERCCGGRLPVR